LRALALEWFHGPFERRFLLPSNCVPDRVDARYKEGILELRFAVEPTVAPTETKVEVS
jgi:HSP20 family molecular chaperone IbpA